MLFVKNIYLKSAYKYIKGLGQDCSISILGIMHPCAKSSIEF